MLFIAQIPGFRPIALLICFAQTLSAWGPTGHRVVGQIAENHLSPETAAMVQSIIGPETLVDVSNWPDWIRSDPEYDYTSSWHYVNLPNNVRYEDSDKHPEGDVYIKILDFIEVLKDDDSSTGDKALAIKWLTHLIGDLHQPLHAGHKDDLGGNRIRCTWFKEPCNLHQIWDTKLIEATHLSYSELSATIERNIVAAIEEGPEPQPALWMQESLQYRDVAYEKPDDSISGTYRYIFDHTDLMKLRLKQAGLRLALTLEYALK